MGRLADFWSARARSIESDPFATMSQEQIHEAAGQAGPMDFADDVVLDPSQTEWRGPGEMNSGGFGGWGPYGGGGGGSWLTGLFGELDSILGGMGGPQPNFTGAGGALSGRGGSSSTGFSAAPSGPDFRGPDFNPQNLVEWQGLVGIPQAIRTLRVAEKRLGLPGLSDAVTGVGFRSREQQAAARARYLAGQGALAAPPGSSFHEQGEAFDISSAWLAANPTAQPWLERHGFTWDVGGEPWHAHYVGGGQPLRPATGNQGRPIPQERRGPPDPLAAYRRRG